MAAQPLRGAASTDRPNQFKLTGMYILPWRDVILSGNFRSQQGRPVTRQISRALAIGAAQTINLEPLGNTRIGTLTTHRPPGRQAVPVQQQPEPRGVARLRQPDERRHGVEASASLTPATTFTDPTTGTRATLQQFLSPTQILRAADGGVPRGVQVLKGRDRQDRRDGQDRCPAVRVGRINSCHDLPDLPELHS